MSPKMKKFGYGVYIIAIALFFMYALFPSEALTAYLAHQLSGGRPDLTVSVDQIKPVLPPGLKLKPVRYARNGLPLFELSQMSVRPELTSLLKSGTVYTFDANAYGGRVVGEAGPFDAETGRAMGLEARLSDFRIEGIPVLARWSPYKLKGRLDGQVSLSENGQLNARLTVADARVLMERSLLGLSGLNFESIDADLVLEGGQISVKSCTLRGPEIEGLLQGSIILNAGGGQATLNLKGTVSPHHALLAKLENSLAGTMLRGRDQIEFRLTGPVTSPAVSFE